MNVEEAYKSLTDAVNEGRNAHAYLVTGSSLHTSELVNRLLPFLMCESPKGRPCGKCQSCSNVKSRCHPDVTWLYPKGKGRVISVESVRSVIKTLQQTSFGGSWKICVLVDAETMNQASANAFLKTLEEPGGKTMILVLTSKPENMLPTIRSRCQKVNLSSAEQPLVTEWNEKLYGLLADDSFHARKSERGEGSVIRAMGFSGSVGKILADVKEWASDNAEEELKWMMDQMTEGSEEPDDYEELLDAAATAKMKEIRSRLIRNLELWHRDILMLVLDAPDGVIYHKDHLEVLKKRAASLNTRSALRNVEQIEILSRYFDRNLSNDEALRYAMSQLA